MKRVLFFIALSLSTVLLFGQNYIDGTLLYHQNPEYPIPEVEATLYDGSGNIAGVATTDDNGYFAFADVPDGVYEVGFETTLEGGDIGINDALNVLFYIIGLTDFTPIQVLAMDVTANGQVNMADFNFILVQYFVMGQPFPAGEWVFEDVEVSTFTRDGATTIGGSRTGDSEGVLVPTGRDMANSYQIAAAEYSEVVVGDIIELPLNLNGFNQQFMGYGLVLSFDPELVEVIDVVPTGQDAQLLIESNEIRMSWLDTQLDAENLPTDKLATFKLRLLSNDLPENGIIFEIKPQSHILDANGNKMDYLSFEMPGLKRADVFLTNSIYPNPAVNETRLSFELKEAAELELQLFNAGGQLITKMQFDAAEGLQTKQISLAGIPAGTYQVLLIEMKNKQIIAKHKLLIQ
ncbi:MAG: T9SS type A sorting domain-containing protein [Bacteroidetes bacterium]|nr:T9SS type A sorting domain-containing protein [Bacteroidota bacterium]MBU1580185.1 T9SS type A sorting domain-containing protein [Bacteroidota bacterium]MBU2465496.1 T9SS type A sorting domain-containing protein [Bacteroidota bacterium]MBU2556427.1 T9SS type A sorting domain-containing protein [Bacteroidota bacterium]